MNLERAADQVAEELGHGLDDGTYTLVEYNERMRDLGREMLDALREEAEIAYEDVMYQRGGYG
ncbi:hypothetical protein LCGC14_2569230 [marine sediment metagenome]|uniref:Uncharacterized protein n=1 Tax=marine sediment metagenome TaxID=412755 RepID=A0A0F9AI60_9ZZZZ